MIHGRSLHILRMVSSYCSVITLLGALTHADLLVTGEGISEFATRHGNLISVRGRLEVKVVDRKSNQLLAIHRQTSIEVDLSEQIAGKSVLQEAAALSVERLLPKLVRKAANEKKGKRIR
jgi:hypothetical protein